MWQPSLQSRVQTGEQHRHLLTLRKKGLFRDENHCIFLLLHNDKLYQPDVRYVNVFALKPTNTISQQQHIQRYPKVFKEGDGKTGDHQIRLNPNVTLEQHV